MKRKYIEINEAYHEFDNKCFEVNIDLVDEEAEDIKTKQIVISQMIWKFQFPKKLGVEYISNKDLVNNAIKDWLFKYAEKQKHLYEKNWESQPDKKMVQSYEIKYDDVWETKWLNER